MKPKPLSLTAAVTVRAAEGDSPVRRFELVAYTGEPMPISGFDLPVVIDCGSLDLEQQRISALLEHKAPVGQITSVEAAGGLPPLRASGVFTPSGQPDDPTLEVINRADNGFQWQASVGGNPASVERYQRGQTFRANGRTYEGPAILARGMKLREISFVAIGGDHRTSAVVATSKPIIRGAAMSFEDWLTSMGFDSEAQAGMSEIQLANMKKMYGDEAGEGDDTTDPADADLGTDATPPVDADAAVGVSPDPAYDPNDPNKPKPPANAAAVVTVQASGHAEVQAEVQRIGAIQAAAKKYGSPTMTVGGSVVAVATHAIRAGWTPAQAEVQAMRSQLRKPPSNIVRGSGSAPMQALQGAMILQAGGRLDHPGYVTAAASLLLPAWLRAPINDAARNQYMEAAHRLSELSAVDFCRESLRAHGRDVPSGRSAMIQAAFSSGSLVNSMTTSMNAKLLAAYLESPDTTQGWVQEDDVPNYLQNERVRTTKGNSLSQQPEDAEADHDTLNDVQETYKVKRYSKQIEVDEIAVVNDALGSIARKPTDFGLAAARIRPDLVYGLLLSNPTLNATSRQLFNGTDANLITSAALSQTSMTTATARMNLITENSVNIDVTPTHLLVPPTLRDPARVIIGSQINLASTTANAPIGNINPAYDYNLDLRPEKRLENGTVLPTTGVLQSGSSTTWYLASKFAPAFEVGYLRGTGRAPSVRSWVNKEKGRYGMGWDVMIAVGVCVLDWKGIEKMTA